MRRAAGWAALLAAASYLLAGTAIPVGAAGVEVPRFGEPRVRTVRPNLATLPRLRFLTTTDFPPFNSLDARGQLAGFNVDLAREICGELELTVACDIQAVPWNELRAALEKGEGDAVVAGVAATAETRQVYAFTKPYLRFPGRFAVSRTEGAEEPLAQALRGGTVGVVAGSAHEAFLRGRFGALAVKAYPGMSEMLADLTAGGIRAAFGDGLRLSFWLNGEDGACCRFAGGPFWAPGTFGSGLAIAVRPGDRLLLDALDFALAEIAAKNRFTELTLRWFPVSFF